MVLIALLLSLAFAADTDARTAIAEQGMTPITVVDAGKGTYTFTATNSDGELCRGSVGIHTGKTAVSMVNSACDPEKSAADFESRSRTACDHGSKLACTRLGAYLGGMPARASEAAAPLELACTLGSFEACFNRGVMSSAGIGVAIDKPAAGAWFTKACDGGYGKACFERALLLVNGAIPGGTAAAVADLGKQGCSAGDDSSCAVWAQITLSGQARAEQAAAARAAATAGCARGSEDCCGVLKQFP